MNPIAQAIISFCLIGFFVGVLLNLRYVVALPSTIPRGARALSYTWLILLSGLAVWFGRTSSTLGLSSIDGSAIFQICSIFLALILFLLFYRDRFKFKNMRGIFALILIYSAAGILTSPLSQVFTLSLFKAFSLFSVTIIAVSAVQILRTRGCPELLLNLTYSYFTIILLTSSVAGLFFPEFTHRENKGVFGFMLVGWPHLNSNSLSFVAAVVLVVGLRRFFDPYYKANRTLFFGLFLLGLGVLLLAQGRTSIGSSALGLFLISFLYKPMASLRWFMLLAAALVLAIFVVTGELGSWFGVTGDYLRRGVSDENLTTLSGRTEAWRMVIEMFYQSPIYGYGFYAAGKVTVAPHNAYFVVLLQTGLLGFLPWIIAIISWLLGQTKMLFLYLRKYRHAASFGLRSEVLLLSIILFFRTVTSQDLTIHSYSVMLLFGILAYEKTFATSMNKKRA